MQLFSYHLLYTSSTLDNTQAEFEDICEEAQLWSKLHDLDQLCQEQGLLEGNGSSSGYETGSIASQKHL